MASSLSGMFSRMIQTVKPHVPMIKFRKGGHSSSEVAAAGHSSGASALQASAAPRTSGSGSAKVVSRATIEDYQLPLRYRRPLLDQSEIDAINSGGAY